MQSTLTRLGFILLATALALTGCSMPGGGGSVAVGLNDFDGTYFYDGPCFPDTFDLQATLSGDTSRVSFVLYNLVIRGASGTHIEVNRDLFPDSTRPGYYSILVNLAAELEGVTEDELTAEIAVRAVDSRADTLGQANRTLTLRRCSLENTMTIRPEISTRDLYYGAGCTSSVTHTVTVSSFTPIPSGIAMEAYWLVDIAGRDPGSADIEAHDMMLRDLTAPGSIHIYEFTDTLAVNDDFAHEVEALLGPLNLTVDPIFVLSAAYELNARDYIQRLSHDDRITIAVHPCSARPMPTATAAPTLMPVPTETSTPTLVPYVPPTKKPKGGEGGGSSSGGSCSDYGSQKKCEAAGCKWDDKSGTCG